VLELSLRKLGFLLPIYADPAGEILSGHQRHLVAGRIGCRQVPVSRVPAYPLDVRKAINIGFNRGTNDMRPTDTPADMTEALARANIDKAAASLPDLDPLSPEFFPCMSAEQVPLPQMLAANSGRWIPYARNAARMLNAKGVDMPVVATRDCVVVNGIGRLQLAAEHRQATVSVVWITDEQAALARAMLNLLSMDFDIHTRYADLLRYNSFRRAAHVREWLGRAFVFDLLGSGTSKRFDFKNPANVKKWRAHYGDVVLDWGAGLLQETKILRDAGVDCTPFEPYYLRPGTSEIDIDGARAIVRKFLEQVAAGTRWQSLFMSAVLNSVPFYQDRLQIVRLLAELAYPGGTLYTCSASTAQTGARIIGGKQYANRFDASRLNFSLGYEPRISLGDFGAKPKVQKYHTPREFQELVGHGFGQVRITANFNNVNAAAWRAKDIPWPEVEAAIRFEFDLPYPGDQRMGLVDEALAAFKERRLKFNRTS
jgi:hypothetical protein